MTKYEYFWVRLVCSGEITIARYSPDRPRYPWEIIASDEIFKEQEVVIICSIGPPSPNYGT